MGKAKGRDALFADIFQYGGKYIIQLMHDFLKISEGEPKCPKTGGMQPRFPFTRVRVLEKSVETLEALLFFQLLVKSWLLFSY